MEKTFSCTQCDKTFKELRTLRLHLKIHNSEYPEQCGVCKKVFRTKWQVGKCF
jgi:transcription elongation factor Elf1